MKINFAHLCDYALVSEGKLSVMGIFGQIRPQSNLPWQHPTFYLAYEIGLKPAELGATIKTRVAIRDQDGETLVMAEGTGKVEAKRQVGIDDQPTVRHIMCFNNIHFKRPGPHEVVIWLQDEVSYTLRFEVTPPPMPQANG